MQPLQLFSRWRAGDRWAPCIPSGTRALLFVYSRSFLPSLVLSLALFLSHGGGAPPFGVCVYLGCFLSYGCWCCTEKGSSHRRTCTTVRGLALGAVLEIIELKNCVTRVVTPPPFPLYPLLVLFLPSHPVSHHNTR